MYRHFLELFFLQTKYFLIRVHSQEMLDTLRDQLGRPIDVADSLILPMPIHDRFVVDFIKTIEENNKYTFERTEVCARRDISLQISSYIHI